MASNSRIRYRAPHPYLLGHNGDLPYTWTPRAKSSTQIEESDTQLSNESAIDENDSLVSKAELASIRRIITRGERNIQVVTKSSLLNLVESLNDDIDEEDPDNLDEEQSYADGEQSDADNEDSDEDSDDENYETPIGKQSLAFLREMMNAIRAKEFKLTRNMYFNIILSLV